VLPTDRARFVGPALAAMINAVVDALAELGVEHVEMPATPGRVWRAIRDARTRE
jgi:carbon-monoxide dehydrogenase large subunit